MSPELFLKCLKCLQIIFSRLATLCCNLSEFGWSWVAVTAPRSQRYSASNINAESEMFLARRLETRNGEAGARQRPITVSLSRSHSASDLTSHAAHTWCLRPNQMATNVDSAVRFSVICVFLVVLMPNKELQINQNFATVSKAYYILIKGAERT